MNTMAIGVAAGRPGWAAVNGFGSCDRLVGMLLEASVSCGLPRNVYMLFSGSLYSLSSRRCEKVLHLFIQ